MQLKKKISAKTVCGDVRKVVADLEDGKKIGLFNIIGVAQKIKTGESDFGPWVALTGKFQATNLIDGEISRSGVAFMPDEATDLIVSALEDNPDESIEFGFNISAVKDESVARGYQYACEPLMQPTEDDPLMRLQKNLAQGKIANMGSPKAADKDPVKTAEKETAPADTKESVPTKPKVDAPKTAAKK